MADVPDRPASSHPPTPPEHRLGFRVALGAMGLALVAAGLTQLDTPLAAWPLIVFGFLAVLLATYGGPIARIRWKSLDVRMRRDGRDR